MSKAKPYIRILLALVMLFLLYRSGLLQLEKIQSTLKNPTIIFCGFIIFILQFLTFSSRWMLITSLMQKVSFKLSLKLHLIGQFFNTFVPGGVGGDVIKAIELSKITQQSKKNTLALTLLDRILGLYSLIGFSFLFLLIELNNLNSTSIKYLTFSGILFFMTTIGLVLREKIRRLFSKMTSKIQNRFIVNIADSLFFVFDYIDNLIDQSKLKHFVFISLVAQILSISFLYMTVSILTTEAPSFLLFFPLSCFAFMAMAIPITPGGIGLGQAAFYFIFKAFNDQTAEAAIIGISLMQLFYIILSLPGGYYFIKSSPQQTRPLN